MSIQHIIREKRNALGLTQEQVANYLGVTAPAVNKWEKGATFPDLALLPALSRLLKTDPNTLLCFEESLSEQEIGRFLNETMETLRTAGLAQGFALAMERIQAYPSSTQLLHSAAMMLDGALMMANLPEEQKAPYRTEVMVLYERVARSDDAALAHQAQYVLASKLLAQGDYSRAQEMLDGLPRSNMPDKRLVQADLWAKEGKASEAIALLERKALEGLQDTLMTLAKLAPLRAAEGDTDTAHELAQASQTACEAFALWRYSALLVPLLVAMAEKNSSESLAALTALVEAAQTPWDIRRSPLTRHMPHKEASPADSNCAKTFLPPLLADLENDPNCDFLRDTPEFACLLEACRQKCAEGAEPSA